jgi:hypothetical protein
VKWSLFCSAKLALVEWQLIAQQLAEECRRREGMAELLLLRGFKSCILASKLLLLLLVLVPCVVHLCRWVQ